MPPPPPLLPLLLAAPDAPAKEKMPPLAAEPPELAPTAGALPAPAPLPEPALALALPAERAPNRELPSGGAEDTAAAVAAALGTMLRGAGARRALKSSCRQALQGSGSASGSRRRRGRFAGGGAPSSRSSLPAPLGSRSFGTLGNSSGSATTAGSSRGLFKPPAVLPGAARLTVAAAEVIAA